MAIKVLETEISVTTANTVYSSNRVRMYAAANTEVTVFNATSNTSYTFTMPQQTVEILMKDKTETIAADNALLCNPVAFTA